jgi:hypothetical protein
MSIDSQIEREEQYFIDQLNAGEITEFEFEQEMRELQRSYRAAAEEAAQNAYDAEMNNWC